ncbi:MAG: hypothetical protein AB9903_35910 [Vulcanimicrobiota bacterium]
MSQQGNMSWDYQTGFSQEQNICIGPDGTIYLGDDERKLVAIKDGKTLWGIKSDDGIGTLFMNVKSNILNVLTNKGTVYALKINETAKNESPKTAQDILDSLDDGKAVINKPGIDESSADGWVIIGGIKLPKKS